MWRIGVLVLLLMLRNVAAQVTVLPAAGPQPTVVGADGRTTPLYTASYALLISQRRYLGIAKNGWRELESTENELDAVAAALQRHGFRVWRARDLSGGNLLGVYRAFIAEFGYRADNRLLMFYSGHGYTNPSNGISYLVPVDATDPNLDPGGFFAAALPLESIQTLARESTARHALFLFDSCFSGSIFLTRATAAQPEPRGSSASERSAFFLGPSARPVRQFIAAGGAKEELPASSVFVPLLLEGLQGRATRNPDGYITGKELGLWLEQTLPQYRPTQNPHSGIIRQPELSFGDIVFQVPAPSPPPVAPVAPPSPVPPTQVAIAPTSPPAQPPAAPVSEKVTFAADTFFDSGSKVLSTIDRSKLESLVGKLAGVNLEVIIAVGHTDSTEGGNDANRQKLSVARAEEVKTYLTQLRIEKNHVYTEGKGPTQPVADNKTTEGRAKNRRVEIEVVGTRRRP